MCGIWLKVCCCSSDTDEQQQQDQSNEIENLSSRGPFHLGCVHACQCQHLVDLKASVLKMRSHSTLQPVALPVQLEGNEHSMHFAWNGEVYQRLLFAQENNDLVVETVAGYDIADTQLVANMLVETCTRMKGENDNSSNDSSDEVLLEYFGKAIAEQVFGRLINAEYAFCLVTPWAIYYGRDPWGRRSLLYWDDKEDESSSVLCSNWRLVSAAEGDETATDNKIWKEVIPGVVYEYRFQSKQFYQHKIPRGSEAALPKLSLSGPPLFNPPGDGISESMWKASLELEHWLRQAVQLRVCGNADDQTMATTVSIPIAVLFSGGIDSVVLAALALQVLPANQTLRLWNVSFVDEQNSTTATTAADCVAAQASYEELLQLFPHHTILLESERVSWEEMTAQESHIRTLIHPKTTTMDLNVGMALWFASRPRNEEDEEPRILLVGMGADEQLGGYGRHRKAFDNGGNTSLRQELDLDIGRLWERNLGRDDRIFSDHGKEARFPYLDYHVTNFLAQAPLENVCDFSLPPGQGDKRILRLLAMRLGLKTASGMVKRAIQFGSRIAHVSDKRRFGSRRKAQGTAVV